MKYLSVFLLLPYALFAQSGTYVRHTECSTDTIIIYENGTFYKSQLYRSDYWNLGYKAGKGTANEFCGYTQKPPEIGTWKANKEKSDTLWINIDLSYTHPVNVDNSYCLIQNCYPAYTGNTAPIKIPYLLSQSIGLGSCPNTYKYFKQ
jgi:hypothetical protein